MFVSILFLSHGSKNVFICLESTWHILFSFLVDILEAALALFYSEKLTVKMLKFCSLSTEYSNLRPTGGSPRQDCPYSKWRQEACGGNGEHTGHEGSFWQFCRWRKGQLFCQFLGLSLWGDLIINVELYFLFLNCVSLIVGIVASKMF